MRNKTRILTLLLLLAAICAFAPGAVANEGDWTPTTNAQWWWKYVRPASSVLQVSVVDVVAIRSDRPGYAANRVTFTLTNKSSDTVKGGASFVLEQAFAEPDPHPWRTVTLNRGVLPTLVSGQAIQITGVAYTPQQGKLENYVVLSTGQ
jgi:hypothetical protein